MKYLNNSFVADIDSKSLSFFNDKQMNINVNRDLINEIKNIAFTKKSNLRINLHSKSSDDFHNMIIFHWAESYIRPHKHLYKGETCHIIEGEQQIIILDENGKNIDNCNMSIENNIIYRINKNTYHSSYILSDYVIFHESKPGPYLGDEDSIFPEWSPIQEDSDSVKKFMNKVFAENI